jgi:hypothetical protein
MTSDHLTPAQKAVSGFWPGYFDTMGWGFGMSVRTRRTHLGPSVVMAIAVVERGSWRRSSALRCGHA